MNFFSFMGQSERCEPVKRGACRGIRRGLTPIPCVPHADRGQNALQPIGSPELGRRHWGEIVLRP
jgi:hypothetical protein